RFEGRGAAPVRIPGLADADLLTRTGRETRTQDGVDRAPGLDDLLGRRDRHLLAAGHRPVEAVAAVGWDVVGVLSARSAHRAVAAGRGSFAVEHVERFLTGLGITRGDQGDRVRRVP